LEVAGVAVIFFSSKNKGCRFLAITLISYCFLITNIKKFFIAAHRAAAPAARRKSMGCITGGFAAGAA